ncbi:MAG: tetraacyldisaccharide 4'-kinase [Porticoccaceae bacterium]|nr:tetraacyldisaccharide 4'-kinase [Porticoccaceae bacterium]MBT4164312.1 tetraacyldisaccharide 4'-kinase [Porticoccaceae bacterium]MBT4210635.1 tetraacyldisaccharide 4'-kinase [Porticoccaceae bacterium]MBT4592158.1 tetraacyldisaccharide 4'-kinase [Porticoccaceae bacterium]MBT5102804.1 tetraacyldisaccharide 4'-kinase [Porticoccaceae bacterium]
MALSAEKRWLNACYSNSSWLLLLAPLSWLFSLISAVRRLILQRLYQGRPFSVPVAVVGNISVGGSGKTPLIIALVKALNKLGYTAGVISRGYGGAASAYPLRVTTGTPVDQSGDEPLLIAQSCGCPVVVDPDRVRAVEFLLHETSCDIVLSDDGLQHYRLHRDIEIAVVDATRGLGNGRMLPSGALRESPSRLSQVDFVVLNGSGADIAAEIGLVGAHQIELQALGLRNIASNLIVPVNAWEGGVKVHAVCGIGHPERFAQTLKELGFEVILSSVNDHQHLSDDDLEFGDDLPMIITSKDAVKYRGVIPDNLWVLEVEMSISEDFVHSLAEQAGLTITAT